MKVHRGIWPIVLGITSISAASAQDRDRVGLQPISGPARLGWEVLDKGLTDTNEKHRQQTILAAQNLGPTREAVKFIAGGLQDKSTLVRQTAAAVFGEMQARDSIPYLKRALDDPNPEVSFTAARALCSMGDPDGRAFLQEVLTGQRSDKPGFLAKNLNYAKKRLTPLEIARMGVNEAAGVLLGPASIGIIIGEEAAKAQLSGKNGESGRTLAAATLADHPDNYTRILLEWALADDHPEVRAAAAKGLSKCGNAESIPKLEASLKDDHAAVRFMAAAALVRLSDQSASGVETSGR